MSVIQFRVDDDLKKQAILVYKKLGIDLSTALRLFLQKSVSTNGLPFLLVAGEKSFDTSRAIKALEKLQDISEKNGNSKMTLDDINREISDCRKVRKNN